MHTLVHKVHFNDDLPRFSACLGSRTDTLSSVVLETIHNIYIQVKV